jgi:hypothetical protein
LYKAADKGGANECMTILYLINATEQRMDELRKTIAAAPPLADDELPARRGSSVAAAEGGGESPPSP